MTVPEGRSTRAERWVERKFSGRSMRPRTAAYLIATVWLIGILLFGVIERLADPKTFPTVWLGFWWAIQTVTTVGYGDVVPTQTSGKVLAAVLDDHYRDDHERVRRASTG
jgi:voltage-gated potassium channel